MSGQEMEPRGDFEPGSLTPMYGPATQPASHTARVSPLSQFMVLFTPRTPGKTFLAKMDNGWFYITIPIRALAIGVLVVTYRWYYFGTFATTLTLLVLLLTSGS